MHGSTRKLLCMKILFSFAPYKWLLIKWLFIQSVLIVLINNLDNKMPNLYVQNNKNSIFNQHSGNINTREQIE